MQSISIAGKIERQDVLKTMNLPMAYIEFDMTGAILNVNDSYLAMSGYTRGELIGLNIKNLWPGEDLLSPAYAEFWNKLKENTSASGVFRRQRKDGSIFWVEAVYHLLREPAGEPERIIAFCLEITNRIQEMEEKLSRLEALDRSFLVASYSRNGKFLEGNENFLSTLGCAEQDLQGKKLEDILASAVVEQESLAEIRDIVRTGRAASGRMQWSAPGATPIWLHSVFTPLFDGAGNVDKIIQISSDVTQIVDSENSKGNLLRMFSNIIDNAGSAVAITGGGNKTIYINKAYTAMFGYTEAEMLGKFPTSIFGPEEKHFLGQARKCLTTNEPYTGEGMAYCKDGKRLWVYTRVTPLLGQTGKRELLVTIFTDVTELKLCELLQSKTLEGLAYDVPTEQLLEVLCLEIERVMPELRVGIMGINKSNALTLLTTSYPPLKQLDSLNLNIEKSQYPACRVVCSGLTAAETNIRDSKFPEKVKELFATMNINACMAAAIKNLTGQIVGVVSFYREDGLKMNDSLTRLAESMASLCSVMMERDANKARMRMLTHYDPLTGLPNRNLLVSGADHVFAEAFSTKDNTPLAVLYINIDHFSRINQFYTYEQGNDILRVAAGRLMHNKEKHDLVGRMFADQFVVISPNCNAEQAFEKAERIQSELGKPLSIDETEISLTSSIGISLSTNNNTCINSLINDANSSLLQNKSKGPGRVSFFSTDLDRLVKTSLSLETHLRSAIEHERLALCYQPQVYIGSGKLYGVEALCRWNDKKCGRVPPEQFIPLAEKTGLIEKLSDWIIREACRQLAEWRGKGLIVPSVAINLSPPSFHDTAFPERIITYLRKFGLSSSDIILELTERVLLDENPATMTTIHHAHELGFALSLDDFGTGYSSLSYLRSLPLSEIKLDQSFVRDLHIKDVSRRLSEAVMQLGQSLKLTVLAEGVENMSQYRLLRQQNCQVAQGYLVSKPLPPDSLEKWLTSWRPQAMADQHSLL